MQGQLKTTNRGVQPTPDVRMEACAVWLSERTYQGARGSGQLTELEVRLLRCLVESPGRDVTRAELLERVWQLSANVRSRCIDTAVRRLRQKLERDPTAPEHVRTVAGIGYRFEPLRERDLSPFVGRVAELAVVRAAMIAGRTLVVCGPPGAGSSRLVAEAKRRWPSLPCRVSAARERPGEPGNVLALGGLEPAKGEALIRLLCSGDPGSSRHLAPLLRALSGLPLALVEAGERLGFLGPRDLCSGSTVLWEQLPRTVAKLQRCFDTLGEHVQAVLTCLAPCHASFSRAEAQDLCGVDPALALDRLWRVGWVRRAQVASQGEARFCVLRVVAGWVMTERPPAPDARQRHMGWAVARAAGARARSSTAQRPLLQHDLAAALRCALEHAPGEASMVAEHQFLLTRSSGAPQRALELVQRAARSPGLPRRSAVRLQLRIADHRRRQGRFRAAILGLKRVLRSPTIEEMPELAAIGQGLMGATRDCIQGCGAGLDDYATAVRALAELGHRAWSSIFLAGQAESLVGLGRGDEAVEALREALLRCRHPQVHNTLRRAMATVRLSQGRLEAGISVLGELLEGCKDRPSHARAAAATASGTAHALAGDAPRADRLLGWASSALKTTGAAHWAARADMRRAWVALLQGELQRAEALFYRAGDPGAVGQSRWGRAEIYAGLAVIFARQGCSAGVEEYQRRLDTLALAGPCSLRVEGLAGVPRLAVCPSSEAPELERIAAFDPAVRLALRVCRARS
jgi:hypothetical protein